MFYLLLGQTPLILHLTCSARSSSTFPRYDGHGRTARFRVTLPRSRRMRKVLHVLRRGDGVGCCVHAEMSASGER